MTAISGLLVLAMGAAFGAVLPQGLEVTQGLQHYQALQADAQDQAAAQVEGASGAAGKLQARVVGLPLVVLDWQDVADVAEGAFEATLPAMPVGGPYRVELRVVNEAGETLAHTAVHHVLVGDLWVLAGQSNMQGVGRLDQRMPPHPQVNLFGMNHQWRIASDPLHVLAESPDTVHFAEQDSPRREEIIRGHYEGAKGVGPGLPFAIELVEQTGRPIGLISSAHGGTSMAQWDPALRDNAGESLYGSMYKQVMNAGGKVRGVLWYQGESDATSAEVNAVFKDKFKELVAAFRSDLDEPELPFLYVQIGRVVSPQWNAAFWNHVQMAQYEAAAELERAAMAATVDLELDDPIHIGAEGQKMLGKRLALLAEGMLFDGPVKHSPRVEKIERHPTPNGLQVHVTFSNVHGRLVSEGRPTGFSYSAGAGNEGGVGFYDCELDPSAPNKVILWAQALPENAHLWYGRGTDPYCNIRDEAGMAVPVFGPMPIP